MGEYLTDDDLYMCKYATAGTDKDGFTIPWCKTEDMACDDVLRFSGACRYEKDKACLRDQIVNTGYIYNTPGKKGGK